MIPDVHLITFYVLTTINTVADAFIFEGWSWLLVSSVILRFGTIICFRFYYRTTTVVLSDRWWKVIYVTPLLLGNQYWLNKMPFTWESDLWSVQVDFVVILWVIFLPSPPQGGNVELHQHDNNNYQLGRTAQDMYACYYTAAGFWKINTHFLDHTSSCATVFLCQHLARMAEVVGLS